MNIEYNKKFVKEYDNADREIKQAFKETLEFFIEDPHNHVLRNHSLDRLGKKYFGLWSIDVTDNWRALYRKVNNRVIFIALGTHEKLYSK